MNKRIERILKAYLLVLEASNTHKRLEQALKDWLEVHRLWEVSTLPSGKNPDLLFIDSQRNLFIADAKNSANETPGNKETYERIYSYIEEALGLFKKGQINSFYFAIATDDSQVADEWKYVLEEIVDEKDISDTNGDEVKFTVSKIDNQTYIIHHM